MRKPWRSERERHDIWAARHAAKQQEEAEKARLVAEYIAEYGDKDVVLNDNVAGGAEFWEEYTENMSREERNYQYWKANQIDPNGEEAESIRLLVEEVKNNLPVPPPNGLNQWRMNAPLDEFAKAKAKMEETMAKLKQEERK